MDDVRTDLLATNYALTLSTNLSVPLNFFRVNDELESRSIGIDRGSCRVSSL